MEFNLAKYGLYFESFDQFIDTTRQLRRLHFPSDRMARSEDIEYLKNFLSTHLEECAVYDEHGTTYYENYGQKIRHEVGPLLGMGAWNQVYELDDGTVLKYYQSFSKYQLSPSNIRTNAKFFRCKYCIRNFRKI